MAKCIMIQGTASSVGKSMITAGLCRVFKQDGYKVAPFKSQNMALNSFITKEGREMGRAQVVQAEAAGLEPMVEMNPVLIKPTADTKAQIIINGEVYGNLTAMEYHNLKPKLREMVSGIYEKLAQKNDIVVIEGAGSPAEINLRENDIVNMGMADMADAPVILVGDIDKGGVFASLAGTMLLLNDDEKARVKGVIINKFRGDYEILKPGIKMLEDIIKIPVLGVLPYADINIDDEDGFLAGKYEGSRDTSGKEIDIAVIKLPHISNDTDFNALANVQGINVRYIKRTSDLLKPDMVIIPGTKNTIEDLLFIRNSGLEEAIIRLNSNGTAVLGICGGYQMLGMGIYDPQQTESEIAMVKGMGLLNASTVFEEKKTMTRVEAQITKGYGIMEGLEGCKITGYEIHMGNTDYAAGCIPYLIINNVLGEKETKTDGIGNEAGNVFGTYIHGIFDSFEFTAGLINNLRKRKGLDVIDITLQPHAKYKEEQYDKLADILRKHLDIGRVYEIINSQESEFRSQNSEYSKR